MKTSVLFWNFSIDCDQLNVTYLCDHYLLTTKSLRVATLVQTTIRSKYTNRYLTIERDILEHFWHRFLYLTNKINQTSKFLKVAQYNSWKDFDLVAKTAVGQVLMAYTWFNENIWNQNLLLWRVLERYISIWEYKGVSILIHLWVSTKVLLIHSLRMGRFE